MPTYHCPYCGRETQHLNVKDAATAAQVTRTTIYNWIRRAEVHCQRRPSGRKFICEASLVVTAPFHGRQPSRQTPVHALQLRRVWDPEPSR